MGMKSYVDAVNTKATAQSEPIPGRSMAKNNAGGYGFEVDMWTRLDRFLILGSEGGTYYVNERTHTLDNAKSLDQCLAEDGERAVNRIVEISVAGRAPKNDPAIFALGYALKKGIHGSTRQAAEMAVPRVCRTSTHLFQLAEVVEALGGWGRRTRRSFANWYSKPEDKLAYQLVKYRQRNGWTHRDILRLSHPKPNPLLAWAAGKHSEGVLPRIIAGYELAVTAETPEESAKIIVEYKLPREAVRTEHLDKLVVQEALLEDMPVHAMVRNLGNMSKSNLLTPGSKATTKVVEYLGDVERLHKSRLHPMSVFLALRTYASGHSQRGSGTWTPVPRVIDALNEAFYACFANVSPTNRKIVVAIDTSGSMRGGYYYNPAHRSSDPVPMEIASVMALVTLATEPNSIAMGFDTMAHDLALSGKMRLDDAIRHVYERCRGGGTNCALPFGWATQKFPNADAFITISDMESWHGQPHPTQALRSFRAFAGNEDVRAVAMSVVATRHSVADPEDALQLNVAGFDSSVPEVINQFFS